MMSSLIKNTFTKTTTMGEIVMDKSYIIRVYKQEAGNTSGIVEDIEKNKRTGFSNANELWNLVSGSKQEQKGNVINMDKSKYKTATINNMN